MAKRRRRRDIQQESHDEEESLVVPPVVKRGKAALEGPPPLRVPPAGGGPALGFGVGLTVPPTFFGMRALSILLRLGGSAAPVRLTFVGAPGTSDAAIDAAFREAGVAIVERRAPGVFDAEMPLSALESFLAQNASLFRRVDAPGWLHGEAITSPTERAEVAISVDEPINAERRRTLSKLGFHVVGDSEGEVRGVILGKDLPDLLMQAWIGPVDVRKVHPPKV
jgi:hypothetical protein